MPLLMLALTTSEHLKITKKQSKSACLACSLSIEEIRNYEWVKLNEKLKRKTDKWLKSGVMHIGVEMELGRSLMPIYQTFLRNDTKEVVQEHHHRIGRLVNHTSTKASETAQRQYATYTLAEALLESPIVGNERLYIETFNYILEKSGLQPKRPRIEVARALACMLQYDGEGLVYNPFAGCSIAGAMLQSEDNFYGDGDPNDKIYSAALLLNHGMGVSNEHFIQRDSKHWLEDKKIDYVISTYTGYIDGKTAFDFCLGKCLADPTFEGKYAGMVVPREIFDHMTDNFKEALNRDWVDSIILLPFGEAAVLIDANREDKGTIRIVDCNNPLAFQTPIEDLISDDMFAEYVDLEEAKQTDFLRSLFMPTLYDQEGYEKVRLGDLVKRIPRKVYDLSKFEEDEQVLAYINREESWQNYGWNNLERRSISSLFSPAYLLSQDCLIVNSAGQAEPRIFSVDFGNAFFNDGFAFIPKKNVDLGWLRAELQESYVRNQLHPYGTNEMVPEPLTEDDYLNLVLYKEIEGYREQKEKEEKLEEKRLFRKEAEQNALPAGTIIHDGNISYKITRFISNGAFGFTYQAEMRNNTTGKKETVALKEYFPWGYSNRDCWHENGKLIREEDFEEVFQNFKSMFTSEPEFIKRINDIPDNHVTEIKSVFHSEEVDTVFYSMKYYAGESLKDMIAADQVPSSERLITEKIVIPMCKALHAMHSQKIQHLDIKPENVVIDENGEAVLIDFGIAQLYGDNGVLVSSRETHSGSPYSAPENKQGNMKYFSTRADIFGVAATLYTLLTKDDRPSPIKNEWEREYFIESCNYSNQLMSAIAEGMAFHESDRPLDAQQFLNLFPGCENIKI